MRLTHNINKTLNVQKCWNYSINRCYNNEQRKKKKDIWVGVKITSEIKMQKSRVRAIKLKGWRMVWHDRMRGEGDNTTDDCCWQLRKRVNTGKKTFCVAQNYVYYYSRILLARCNEGWFLYIWESRVKKRMPVRRIKVFCCEVKLFQTLFLFLVCFCFNFFGDDFCPIF